MGRIITILLYLPNKLHIIAAKITTHLVIQLNDYILKETILDAQSVLKLRASVGWKSFSEQTITNAVANSIFFASIWHNDEAVAMARVVGDGYQYFYLQDMIVNPAHQNKGLCTQLTEHLIAKVKSVAVPGSSFGLVAAPNKAAVYEKFGFVERPPSMPAMMLPLF